MSRDHRKLRVFQDSHRLTLAIYRHTKDFPRDEWFGLRAQMRRAAVSIPSNIVEGNARRGTREYLNFLNIAFGSACELKYLIALAHELGYIHEGTGDAVQQACDGTVGQLYHLIRRLEQWLNDNGEPAAAAVKPGLVPGLANSHHRPRIRSPKTEDRRPKSEV